MFRLNPGQVHLSHQTDTTEPRKVHDKLNLYNLFIIRALTLVLVYTLLAYVFKVENWFLVLMALPAIFYLFLTVDYCTETNTYLFLKGVMFASNKEISCFAETPKRVKRHCVNCKLVVKKQNNQGKMVFEITKQGREVFGNLHSIYFKK